MVMPKAKIAVKKTAAAKTTKATAPAKKVVTKKTVAAAPKAAKAVAIKKTAAPMAVKKAPVKKSAPIKTTVKPKQKPTPEERYNMVATAAYFIAERNGFGGCSITHWTQAEAEIAAQLG